MNPLTLLATALREVMAHKFRSLLSMLGIVLGVTSLIATLSIMTGIEIGSRTFMEQMGGLELVRVEDKEISARMADFWNLSPGRTLRDAEVLKYNVPGIRHVTPGLLHGATIETGDYSDRAGIWGIWPDHFVVDNHSIGAGRFLSWLDEERATKAVVIGATIAEEFFPNHSAEQVVGKTLLINRTPFLVVGVLEKYERADAERRKEIAAARRGGKEMVGRQRSWDPFRHKNRSILIPFSTMFYEFKAGLFPLDAVETIRLNMLTFKVEDLSEFRDTLQHAQRALVTTHRGVDDYEFTTREEWFDRMEASIAATRLSGGMIAAISLVVGAIGITNIMLASISERIREIGIRRSVGARSRDIFFQILVESVCIASIGGLVGIFTSVLLVSLLEVVAPSENAPVMQAGSILLSLGFALLAGIVSGLYPAIKASRLGPMEALRYE